MSRNLTPLQQLVVEALQEDERLTAGLADDQAMQLLRWATTRAVELTVTIADEPTAEMIAQALRQAVRAAARADGTVATAERTLTTLLPTPPSTKETAPDWRADPASDVVLGSATDRDPVHAPPDTISSPPSPQGVPVYPKRWLHAIPFSLLAHLGRR
ncbi:hypothetical protein [Chloroflexus sp.]|uniref:hypothetical protein n=1 Tax=Chloroflexus sp. TaxID=1904827 RepID=UPI00404B3056